MNAVVKAVSRYVPKAGLLLTLLSVAGCALLDRSKEEPHSGPAGVPSDWIGHELGLDAPVSQPTGQIVVVTESDAGPAGIDRTGIDRTADVRVLGEAPPGAQNSAEPPTPTPTPGTSTGIVSVNVASGETFTQAWDAAAADRILRAVSNEGLPLSQRSGVFLEPPHEPPHKPQAPGPWAAPAQSDEQAIGLFLNAVWQSSDAAAPKLASWSDGIASFLRLGIAEGYGTNHRAYRSIGQIGSGCSGTLIGPRHVLTAAHCVVDRVNQVAYSASFRPRRDWSEGTMAPTAPHGSRSFVWYYFPLRYWDGVACNGSSSCNQYDIALGILSSDMPVAQMGYWFAPISTLNTWTKYNRGYPRCFSTEPDTEAPRPDPLCQRSTLFGDAQTCQIGDWRSVGPDDYNRELFVNCDGARGMSGSPMYRYHESGNPVALGVYSQFLCTAERCAGDANGEYPNIFTRVTPQSAGWIAANISLWSCPTGFC